MSRYGNQKVRITDSGTDHIFDSKLEARHYIYLSRKDNVSNLQLQVPFIVIPATCVSRQVKYIADFVYDEEREYEGHKFKVRIICDSKGVWSEKFELKWKLMMWKFEREKLPWIFRVSYDAEDKNFEDYFVTENEYINNSEDKLNPLNWYYLSSQGIKYSPESDTFKKAWKRDQVGAYVPGEWIWKY